MTRLAAVLAAALALSGSTLPAQDDVPGTVLGRITAEAGQIPLSYAYVELRLLGQSRSAFTDAEGRYRFDDVPAGSVTLRAQYLGHRARTLEIIVPSGGNVTMDLGLTEEAVQIPGLVVRGAAPFTILDPDGAGPLRPATAGVDVELALLELTPGLAEVALPPGGGQGDGGESPADPSHVLLMRGSTADLKLVLLDGAPVYTPFHLGGLIESFDPGALGRAAHHVGGAPARYDGGLSYILDLETRRPRAEPSGHAALDLLSAGAGAEFGLGPASFLVSARALHNGGPQLLEGARSPYGYRDGLVRAALPVGFGEFSFTLFSNAEEVRLGSDPASILPEAARWGNTALSTRFTHRVAGADLRWTAARSRYDAELPLHSGSQSELNPVLARGETGRWRLGMEGERALGTGTLRFGAGTDQMDVHFASRLLTRSGVVRTDTRSDGRVMGGHLEFQRPLGGQVVGRLGGRIDHFDPGGVHTALRGALAWSLTPDAVLTLSGGRYHQLTRAADSDVESALLPEDAIPGDANSELVPFLAVGTGDHMVLGLDQTLSEAFQLGLRGFVKRFSGVGGADRHLNSSGIDVRLQAAEGLRTGWLGYALSWSWETDGVGAAAGRFLGRHLLTAGYRGPVSGPLGAELRVAFSDGLPYTEVALGLNQDEARTPEDLQPVLDEEPALAGDADGFLRVDVELFAEWETRGGKGRIRPYVRVMNALDRRDALFYYFEPWRDRELTPLATRSVLPVLGVAWSF